MHSDLPGTNEGACLGFKVANAGVKGDSQTHFVCVLQEKPSQGLKGCEERPSREDADWTPAGPGLASASPISSRPLASDPRVESPLCPPLSSQPQTQTAVSESDHSVK